MPVAWLSVRPTDINESDQMRCPVQGNQRSFRSAIRAKDARLCLQRALAAMLVERYTLSGVDFPDPSDADQWCAAD